MTELTIRPDDRVLITTLSDLSGLRELARGHALVGLGTDDEVRAARRALADLDNVMFVVGSRDEIPWMDHWFTVIVDPGRGEPVPAMLRVLAEGGRIVTPPL